MFRITLEWTYMILQRYLNQDHCCLEWLLQLSLHYIFLGNQISNCLSVKHRASGMREKSISMILCIVEHNGDIR